MLRVCLRGLRRLRAGRPRCSDTARGMLCCFVSGLFLRWRGKKTGQTGRAASRTGYKKFHASARARRPPAAPAACHWPSTPVATGRSRRLVERAMDSASTRYRFKTESCSKRTRPRWLQQSTRESHACPCAQGRVASCGLSSHRMLSVVLPKGASSSGARNALRQATRRRA